MKMLPVLLFESAWKLLWLGLVVLPKATGDRLDSATSEVLVGLFAVGGHPRGDSVAIRLAALRPRVR